MGTDGGGADDGSGGDSVSGGDGGFGSEPGGDGGAANLGGGGGGGGVGFGGGGGGFGDPAELAIFGGAGGGGAGYGAGSGGPGGGGGGSSFAIAGASLLVNDVTNTGDGSVVITYEPVADACPVATTIDLAKRVVGTATGDFAATINCSAVVTAALGFDASGAPTTTSDPGTWSPIGGRWRAVVDVDDAVECTVVETGTAGAASTRWTCAAEGSFVDGAGALPECASPSGSGTGPVEFELGAAGEGLESQTVSVELTNTMSDPNAADALLLSPRFTG
jgi:hypothetical protein